MSCPEPAADDSLAEEAARWFLRINEAGNDSPVAPNSMPGWRAQSVTARNTSVTNTCGAP